MLKIKGVLLYAGLTIVILQNCALTLGNTVSNLEWEQYKQLYGKNYSYSATQDAYARYFYSYNKNLISLHNIYYNRGLRSFGLKINQFTDMLLASFKALFPETTRASQSFNSSLPPVNLNAVIPNTFDPVADLGYNLSIEDQGTACHSGWAYATAKSIELSKLFQTGIKQPTSLSAQNLIDCAGQSKGCANQIPQTGFDYLTQYKQQISYTSEYPNNKNQSEQGMCMFPQNITNRVGLQQYGFIKDKDDEMMRRYLYAQYPVVIEFNPTSFEFMHYSEGIFQQPIITGRGSHFLTVIGYGVNATSNLNYFIAQNSFGTNWGEQGLIRIAYSNAKPLAKSAILPIF